MFIVLEGQGGAEAQTQQLFGAGEQWHISTRARARSGVLPAGLVTGRQSQSGSALHGANYSPPSEPVPCASCTAQLMLLGDSLLHSPGLHYAKCTISPSLEG